MSFLTGPDIQAHVRRIASCVGEVMAAVAYWGEGAADRTGLAENPDAKNIRIICDLLSGACNPAEIETLMQLGITVRTLDRLHAKIWINGDDVLVGSANASRSGLPSEDEQGASANIEAAVLSQNPDLAREVTDWFERQWCASTDVQGRHLDLARQLWKRRSSGRGFTSTLIDTIRNPAPSDQFFDLRVVAYPGLEVSPQAEEFVTANAGRYFTDDEWDDFGDESPWFEWPLDGLDWCRPGTVFIDFTCPPEGGEFTFNGFWQMRHCPPVELPDMRLTLLTKLPHFNGYSLSQQERGAIVRRIQETVVQRGYETDELGFYVDERFLEFWDTERAELRERLVIQVVEAARALCRADQFTPSLTLRAIRVCMEDPEWLSGYTRYLGGGIYQQGHPLKRRINPQFGQRVKAGVGAQNEVDEYGESVTEDVEGEIVHRYTLFRSFDPAAVETA